MRNLLSFVGIAALLSFQCNAALKLTDEQFEMIKANIIDFEQIENEPYVGKNGVITLGAGQAIGQRYKPKGKTYYQTSLWSLADVNKFFKKAGIHQMSKAEHRRLQELTAIVNRDLRNRKEAPFGRTLINRKGKPKYILSDKEAIKLLEASIREHERKLNADAKARGIDLSKRETEIIVTAFDLHYRGGVDLYAGKKTPRINKATIEGDNLAFIKEVYAYSNGDDIWQNDMRNAYFCTLIMRLLTDKERLEFVRFRKHAKDTRLVNWRVNKMLTDKEKKKSIPEKAVEPLTLLLDV